MASERRDASDASHPVPDFLPSNTNLAHQGDTVTTTSSQRALGPDIPPDLATSSSRLLTIEDVASYLGVSERWVYQQVRNGRLPAMLIARSWRLRWEAVDHFAESFRHDPGVTL